MKKITLLFLSIFVTFSLMAQLQVSTPSGHFELVNSTKGTALYSQMSPDFSGIASQEFPDFGNCRLQSADDFVVPSGGWDITSVEVLGSYFNGTGPVTTFIVEIYADNSGLPNSTALFSQTGLTYTDVGGLFSIPLSSTIQLDPGHYWISIMADMDFLLYGQWAWQMHAAPQINYPFANQDPCVLIGGAWGTTWTTGTTTMPGYPTHDFCFAIYGAPSIPVSNWALGIGLLLISGFIVIRFRRRLA